MHQFSLQHLTYQRASRSLLKQVYVEALNPTKTCETPLKTEQSGSATPVYRLCG